MTTAAGNDWHILNADCVEMLRALPDSSVHLSLKSIGGADLGHI